MNNFQLQFSCVIKKTPYEILVNDQYIKLRNFDDEILIKLNLQLQLQWIIYGIIQKIKQFNSFEKTLYNNLNNETKIKKLKSLKDLRVVACKCFSKLQRSYSDIIQEIQLY